MIRKSSKCEKCQVCYSRYKSWFVPQGSDQGQKLNYSHCSGLLLDSTSQFWKWALLHIPNPNSLSWHILTSKYLRHSIFNSLSSVYMHSITDTPSQMTHMKSAALHKPSFEELNQMPIKLNGCLCFVALTFYWWSGFSSCVNLARLSRSLYILISLYAHMHDASINIASRDLKWVTQHTWSNGSRKTQRLRRENVTVYNWIDQQLSLLSASFCFSEIYCL